MLGEMTADLHKTIFHRMPNAAMILDANLVYVDANEVYCRAVQRSREQLLGHFVFDVFPDTPERVAQIREIFERTLAGAATQLEAQPYRLDLPDGRVEERIWQIAQFPIHCDEGHVQYLVQRAEDVTEREALRGQRDLVTAELNHRVRNTLAVVQSVADQTGMMSNDIESFLTSFNGRLGAMSRNFAALTDSHWQGLDFESILRTELEPYAGPVLDRVKIEGEPITLSVRASKFTSMLVHELITNASKYGFLTSEKGELCLRWWIDKDRFHAQWTESGLEDIRSPEKTGFGFQMFDMMPNVDVDFAFKPDGLDVQFSVPVVSHSATGEIEFERA
ncbi:MAG: sensor histidine kinase [Henriciella sp.]